MLKKILEFVGGYVVVKTIFKAGALYGEAKAALNQIRREGADLKDKLKEDRESYRRYYA